MRTRARHSAPRHRSAWRFGEGRTRALLSLGVVAVLGATGTLAYWSDSATVTGTTILTGTFDLTAGPVTGAEQLTGTGPNNWDIATLGITDLVPGESVSATIVVRNSGTAALKVDATVATTTNDLTSGTQGLLVQVYDGSTAGTATGTQAAGNRSGPCTGGTQVYSGYPSTTASTSIFTTAPTLATTGATRDLCVRAQLSPTAPNALQAKTTKVQVALSGTQVAAP